jgi:hypothetical protein
MKTVSLIWVLVVLVSSSKDMLSQTIPATRPYLGDTGSCRLQINFLNGTSFTRPFIVVEGFDPEHIIQPENVFGFTSLEDFQNSLDDVDNLLATIETDYDIIYVNWVNGTDYLQRNAFALEAVIQWVNEQKALQDSEPLRTLTRNYFH